MATAEHDVAFETATRDEIHAELDILTQEALGISADEFIERWSDGDLDSFDPTVARLGVLARLLKL
jgi:hypothetical protein